ncbi:MAG TPA: DUF3108 domain-containing protein [Steroidobacteraceae bacterium]|nr:DUF3108 domain-containing protein [Steroidobacteraceae bacterium]
MNRNHLFKLLLGIALALSVNCAWSQDIRTFTARYQLRFYGLSGGILQLTLRKGDAPNEFIYESRAEPSFLGSFMVSDQARESCTMTIDENGVRPLKFFSDDGKKGDEKDSNIQFDWERKRLTGRSERVDFNQELPEHIQDHLSIQIAVIRALLQNSEPGEYSLMDTGEIKKFTYSKDGTGTVKYKGRTLDATIIRSARSDNPGGRIIRYWHAPELGYVPVRAERSRNGKIDLTMDLLDVKFPEAPK